MAARRKIASKSRRRPSKPRPTGFRTVTPYLAVRGAEAAIKFYTKAFGAKEVLRHETPDGRIMHSRLKIGDSFVMISDIYEESKSRTPPTPDGPSVTLHLYLPNVDTIWASALKAGATVEMPLDDMFWGERYGQLSDPFGHHWSLSTPVKMSKAEMQQLQEASMKAFADGGA
jgi:PhnB protein